jgi:hypothetical protein
MTFEERIDRLTERHEALSQSLELMYRDLQEQRLRSEKDGEPIHILAGIAKDTLDSIKRLESIAVAHNDRIEGSKTVNNLSAPNQTR